MAPSAICQFRLLRTHPKAWPNAHSVNAKLQSVAGSGYSGPYPSTSSSVHQKADATMAATPTSAIRPDCVQESASGSGVPRGRGDMRDVRHCAKLTPTAKY